jgi:hypothetical protein
MQTSIEWLWEHMPVDYTCQGSVFELFEQAKEMHKAERETLYTEEQLKLAYMQGYNRGKDGNPNHMESYIKFLKQPKKD